MTSHPIHPPTPSQVDIPFTSEQQPHLTHRPLPRAQLLLPTLCNPHPHPILTSLHLRATVTIPSRRPRPNNVRGGPSPSYAGCSHAESDQASKHSTQKHSRTNAPSSEVIAVHPAH
ncbi:hypothetical protein BKA56DRAFT_123282 [Ilyonectria sp. MPI-CAGE-AT-0026]|nr:hypothetical protein BKA56DRAFT_123282 [Ilyonectria sp. MPI-CAGE-AT-0026]